MWFPSLRPYKALCLRFWARGWCWLHTRSPGERASLPGAHVGRRRAALGCGKEATKPDPRAGDSGASGWVRQGIWGTKRPLMRTWSRA